MKSERVGEGLLSSVSHLALQDQGSVLQCVAQAQHEWEGIGGIVDQIGVALLGAYVNAGTGQADGGVVALAVRYMQEHLTDNDCLVRAHVAAGVSRNTPLRRFHIELGVTPARHLWRLRAERGIALLAKTEKTVAEIGFACGFSDPFHFSRVVKSLQGVSPKELRQRLPG